MYVYLKCIGCFCMSEGGCMCVVYCIIMCFVFLVSFHHLLAVYSLIEAPCGMVASACNAVTINVWRWGVCCLVQHEVKYIYSTRIEENSECLRMGGLFSTDIRFGKQRILNVTTVISQMVSKSIRYYGRDVGWDMIWVDGMQVHACFSVVVHLVLIL